MQCIQSGFLFWEKWFDVFDVTWSNFLSFAHHPKFAPTNFLKNPVQDVSSFGGFLFQ
jgi:hypothetical protein